MFLLHDRICCVSSCMRIGIGLFRFSVVVSHGFDFSVLAKRLAGKSIFKITYFVSSMILNLILVNKFLLLQRYCQYGILFILDCSVMHIHIILLIFIVIVL